MSVGVPALDSDHRCLVRIINLLAEVDHGAEARSTVETVLETLAMYARYHFAREERLMVQCGFPASQFHHAAHDEFTDYVHGLRVGLAGRATPDLAKELFDYLTQWLRHHILIQDMAYKPYVSGACDEADITAGPRDLLDTRPAHPSRMQA
ncbi:MAG: bacteriohemerythrin [Rhodospirillales bacterium]|jgi:hemerythrin-like metal-binding protein|nr:bacteriohemerythrin [Rhodospirillales bacterium]